MTTTFEEVQCSLRIKVEQLLAQRLGGGGVVFRQHDESLTLPIGQVRWSECLLVKIYHAQERVDGSLAREPGVHRFANLCCDQ